MKEIEFKKPLSTKIYKDYISRIRRVTKSLSSDDRLDTLMEFNSHIYEHMAHADQSDSEEERLMLVLETLGAPEEVLVPMIAEKTLEQGTRTFNPFMIFRGLIMNLANGISYFFFAVLYLFLFAFVFVILAELIWPTKVGMYFKDGELALLGIPSDMASTGMTEVLGAWFIPFMIVLTAVWYIMITVLLRIKQKFLK